MIQYTEACSSSLKMKNVITKAQVIPRKPLSSKKEGEHNNTKKQVDASVCVSVIEITDQDGSPTVAKSQAPNPFHLAKTLDKRLEDRAYFLQGISDRMEEIDSEVRAPVKSDLEIEQYWIEYCRRVQNMEIYYSG